MQFYKYFMQPAVEENEQKISTFVLFAPEQSAG